MAQGAPVFQPSVCPKFRSGDKLWSAVFGNAQAGDTITIKQGDRVWLDVSTPVLQMVDIKGSLFVQEDTTTVLRLQSHEIYVQPGAEFIVGCEARAFGGQLEIVLYGQPMRGDTGTYGVGSKVMSCLTGGHLELHGTDMMTWTNLAETAVFDSLTQQGATEIRLAQAVDWPVGSNIVLATTDYDMLQSEVRTITAVAGGGTLLTLNQSLTYMHWGEIWTGQNGDEIDMRGEVGLLSHNIRVYGDCSQDSCAGGWGGHTLHQPGTTVRYNGVEFHHMGQAMELGRYPVHWHLAKNCSGSYIVRCAIHDTFQRAITVHWSHDLFISEVVAYNITGHAFFLEDAIEQGNLYTQNLGIKLWPHTLLESDDEPAVFWVTFPFNHFRNNVAVGATFGFWYSLPEHSVGIAQDYEPWTSWPRNEKQGDFKSNKAHSMARNGLHIDDMLLSGRGNTELASYSPRILPPGLSSSSDLSAVEDSITWARPSMYSIWPDFTAYKCSGWGIWMRGDHIRILRAKIADCANGMTFPGTNNIATDSVIVGDSPNVGMPWLYTYSWAPNEGRTRPVRWWPSAEICAIRFYDCCGPYIYTQNRIYNFADYTFQDTTWGVRRAAAFCHLRGPNVLPLQTYIYNNWLASTVTRPLYLTYGVFYDTVPDPAEKTIGVTDLVGDLTGECGATVISQHPIMRTSDCVAGAAGANQYICPATSAPRVHVDVVDVLDQTYAGYQPDVEAETALFVTRLSDNVQLYADGNPIDSYPINSSLNYLTAHRRYNFNLVAHTTYYLQFTNTTSTTPANLTMAVSGLWRGNYYTGYPATPAEWIRFVIPYPPATTFDVALSPRTDVWDDKLRAVPASSVATLSKRTPYYFDSATGLLYVHMEPMMEDYYYAATQEYITNNVNLQIGAMCPGGNCDVAAPPTPPATAAPTAAVYSRCLKDGGVAHGRVSLSTGQKYMLYDNGATVAANGGVYKWSLNETDVLTAAERPSWLATGAKTLTANFGQWGWATMAIDKGVANPIPAAVTHLSFDVRLDPSALYTDVELDERWRVLALIVVNDTLGEFTRQTLGSANPFYNDAKILSTTAWTTVKIPLADISIGADVPLSSLESATWTMTFIWNVPWGPARVYFDKVYLTEETHSISSDPNALQLPPVTVPPSAANPAVLAGAAPPGTGNTPISTGTGTGTSGTSSNSRGGGGGLSSGAIAGIAVGGIFGVLLLLFAVGVVLFVVILLVALIAKFALGSKDDDLGLRSSRPGNLNMSMLRNSQI